MAFYNSFLDVFKKNSELAYIYDLDLIEEVARTSYAKKLAVDTVVSFMARSLSTVSFKLYDKGNIDKGSWFYKLNIRPNKNNSSCQFWEKVFFKLIYDNEVLIVLSDEDDLLIADSFNIVEYALFENSYKDVIVGDFKYKRTFTSNEVIHLKFNNDKLEKTISGLFSELNTLLDRSVSVNLRNNQVRATVDVESTGHFDEKAKEELQKYIDKIFTSFNTNSIAIVPQLKGFKYNEVSKNTSGAIQDSKEITKLIDDFIRYLCLVVGLPYELLINGDVKQISEMNYIKFTVNPILEKLSSELNMKLFTETEYLEGSFVKVSGINSMDIFTLANSIDKLISSGSFNRNEIRDILGYDSIENGDKFIITKNYEETENKPIE